jgi:hypothetical protein
MSINFDKHHIEKRHDKRFFATFLMFTVIAVTLGVFLVLTIMNINEKSAVLATSGSNEESAGASLGGTSSVAAKCTDSDGGLNPYEKGTVKYKGKSYIDFCWENGTNVTASNYSVAEFYCWNNQANRTLIYCPDGCSNGACLINVTKIIANITVLDTSPGAKLDGYEWWGSQNGRCCAGQQRYACCAMN